MAEKIAKGIRRDQIGFQIYARVKGEFVSQRFPPDTSIEVLRDALTTMRAQAHLGLTAQVVEATQSFRALVKIYLKAKAAMPTIVDRTHRIEWWRDALGPLRSPETVTSIEVRQQLEVLRKGGRKPGTLNVYRTALWDFYTVTYGKSGRNPVRDVPPCREEELRLDLPEAEAVDAVFACLRVFNKRENKSRLRLEVLRATGWPSAVLKKLRPQDVHWRSQTATTAGRLKGSGTKPRTVPLSAHALEALKAFAAAKAWGPFSNSSLYKALRTAQVSAGVAPFRVYDLRHLFISTVVEKSADERGAAELALHSSPKQTWRYSRRAATPRAKAALDAAFPSAPAGPSPATPPMRLVKTPLREKLLKGRLATL